MKKNIRLSPQFMCYPIWMEEDALFLPISHFDLKISNELKKKIEDWDSQYQSIYVDSDPINSKFKSEVDEKKFIEIGYQIKKTLQLELGSVYKIVYKP